MSALPSFGPEFWPLSRGDIGLLQRAYTDGRLEGDAKRKAAVDAIVGTAVHPRAKASVVKRCADALRAIGFDELAATHTRRANEIQALRGLKLATR